MINANIPLVSCIFVLTLGSFVFLKNPRALLNILFLLFALSISVWLFGTSMMFRASTDAQAIFWDRFIYMGVVFIPVLVHHFSLAYTKKKSQKILLLLGYVFAFVFLFSSQTDYFVKGLFKYKWGRHTVAQPLHHVFLILFWIQVTISMRNLYQYYTNPGNVSERNRTKYVFVAYFSMFFIGGFAYLPAYKIPVYPFPFLAGVILVTVLAYAIVRYRLMDIRVAVTRAGIFLTVYSLVLGLPFWFAFTTNLWVWSMVLMGVFASSGPFLFILLRRKAENILLAEQKRYQRILLQASSGMLKEHNLDRLVKLIVHIIKRTVKIQFVMAFLNNTEEQCYCVHYVRSSKRNVMKGERFPYDHPLVKIIEKKKAPFFYNEMPDTVRAAVPADPDVHLIIPSYVQDKMLGFLCLGAKEDKTMYTDDDINIFITLSNQAALAIENCIFMEEFRKSQEKLFTAEKLASIGGMADGMAHQLKNRLNLFSMASGELIFELDGMFETHKEYIGTNGAMKTSMEYLKEGLGQINNNVKRTDNIIKGILNFARTEAKETYFGEFGVTELVNQGLELVRIKHQMNNIPLKLEIAENDMVYGVKSQLQEVFYNLMDNAYEAIEERKEKKKLEGGRDDDYVPEIVFKLTQTEKGTLIEVQDNGMGIKEENAKKVFAPFFTTKSSYKSGSGIGMYVVQRMVEENHKGKIWFTSEYGKGTRIFVELPLKKNKAAN